MRIEIGFAWYDFWIGFYYDIANRRLYIYPLPMVVIRISALRRPD